MDTLLTLGAAEAGSHGTDRPSEFEDMVQTYRPRVFRFLLASVRDRESAENLTRIAFFAPTEPVTSSEASPVERLGLCKSQLIWCASTKPAVA